MCVHIYIYTLIHTHTHTIVKTITMISSNPIIMFLRYEMIVLSIDIAE
jgi:hypothetical protein